MFESIQMLSYDDNKCLSKNGSVITSKLVVWASNLLYNNVDLITVLHVEVLRGLILMKSLSIEKEPHVAGLQLNYFCFTDCLWQ